MRKIYFPVFGSGLGHITRINEIANCLRKEGDDFLYSTFGEALDYLKRNNEKVVECPSVDLRWNESGGFSSKDSFVRFPSLFLDFTNQVRFEFDKMSKFDPNLVVSDSRLSAVFAARMESLPMITILNQFKILFPPRFRESIGSKLYERIAGNVLGLFWDLSSEVLMPDLPPPYTISEANVAGSDVSSRVKYVGFIAPTIHAPAERLEKVKKSLSLDSRPLVFIQVSGPNVTKRRFVDTALVSTDELSRKYNVVVSMGNANASSEPRRLANDAWLYEWCPIKDELFVLADLLVARSGHTTISQCIDLGKPAVLAPIYNHSEQIWNAEKFQKMGLGIEIRAENLSARKLVDSVEACIEDSRYAGNAHKLQSVSRQYNGLDSAVQIINSYL
ncbi:MAG: glycosyltransferase [Nitrososphaerales archaeon]